MKRERIISELEQLAESLDVKIRYEKMGVLAGGLCRIGELNLLFVNKSLSDQAKIELISSELQSLEWDKHFVKPEIAELLTKRS
jgi:hypothetical protein